MKYDKFQFKWKAPYKMATPLSPAQCRAARALLGWTQKELESKSGVNLKTIADFERAARTPFARTIRDIVEALEAAGIKLLAPEEGVHGQGVVLAWGVEPAPRQGGEEEEAGANRSRRTRQSGAADPALSQLYNYWQARPHEWMRLSEPLRRAVIREIHDDLPPFDPILEGVHVGETSPGS